MANVSSCCVSVLLFVASATAGGFSIDKFGAKPDGSLSTEAISNAVAACVAQGGGHVVVPAGRWTTGPVTLRSNVELHLEKDAVLFIPDDPALRPTVRCFHGGRYVKWPMPGIYAVGCTNVAMTGAGTLETATDYWHANRKQARPQAIYFGDCTNVRLEGFKVRGSPSWTMHLFGCTNVVVRGIDSRCLGPNTDGLDLESVEGALVENCRLDQGDDAFCVKSGRGREGRERNRPSQHIVIRNCTVVHGHTLLGIGSELSGGIRDVVMENCHVEDEVWRFLRVKTNPARGGFVEDVRMENVTGGRATEEIFALETDYWWKQESKRNPEIVPTRIRGIRMRNVSAESAKRVERRSVKEGPPPEDIVLENVTAGSMDEAGARIVELDAMRPIRFVSSKDGTKQDAWFFAPKADAGRRVPLVVCLHSWSANWKSPHPREKFFEVAKKESWALVAPNFRGPNQTPKACGSDFAVQDILDSVAYAKTHADIDENRVYLVGSSGGGMMTLLMAGRSPETWAACYAACPISDLARWHCETASRNDRWSRYAGMMEKSCGGSPEARPDEYAHRSPITHLSAARKAKLPIDICEGIHDGHIGSVPVGQSIRAYNALADEKDRISEEDIAFIERNEKVPERLAFKGHDPFFDDSIRIYLRKESANVRLTLFEAGHAGNLNAAADWFTRQRRGRPADWSVPATGSGSQDNSTY